MSLKIFCSGCPCRQSEKSTSIQFEVSVRTIYRDIDAISASGIPIYAMQGKKGGIVIDEEFTLDRLVLSSKEKEQILTALQGLHATHDKATNELLTKISALFQIQTTN